MLRAKWRVAMQRAAFTQELETIMQGTATAYQIWDERWQSDAGRKEWLNPDPRVLRLAQRLREAGALTALDLGCGVGRHSLALARLGYVTTAFDASLSGLQYTRKLAAEDGLGLIFERGNMNALGFPDASFDLVVSINVVYHGDESVVRQTLSEVKRVLKPGGVYHGTMLSKRNHHYGAGTEVSPNTFVKPDGDGDKMHPHYFCDAGGLVSLFDGFSILSMEDVEQKGPGTWHWYVTAERPTG